jgi:hypothetical protein
MLLYSERSVPKRRVSVAAATAASIAFIISCRTEPAGSADRHGGKVRDIAVLFYVKVGNKCGFINRAGSLVIPAQFDGVQAGPRASDA